MTRSSGVAAVMVLVAVLLASGGLPALSAHAPIDGIDSGDQPSIEGAGVGGESVEGGAGEHADAASASEERGDGEPGTAVHDDVAEPAAEVGLEEPIEGAAGLLALLIGPEGVDGALGDSADLLEETDVDSSAADDESSTETPDDAEDTDDRDEDDGATQGDDGSLPDAEGLADSVDLGTVGLAIGAIGALLVVILSYRTGLGIVALLRSLPRAAASAVTSLLFGIATLVERAVSAIGSVAVYELPGRLIGAIVGGVRSVGSSVRSLATRREDTVDTEDAIATDREQIRSAWRTVVDAVSVDRHAAYTPGEIKHRAVQTGLPEPAVTTLLGAFRDVEYGRKDPSERTTGAVDAAHRVETAALEAEDGTTTSSGGTE